MPPAKKPSLAAAMQEASGKKQVTDLPVPVSDLPPDKTPPSRMNTKMIGGHFDPVVSKQLRRLALEHDTTVQGLLTEALNDLFVKYGEKPLA